ncbi:capsular polysaccharide export protein, LipB/KpsS family, partial [Aeromonas sp. QDB48]|uniref:capsular polysaccharide export protein, LipB/KpsS family n=1 Tax=unclassified Aeromonas TaxID=257493 RepID=UPI003FA4928C
ARGNSGSPDDRLIFYLSTGLGEPLPINSTVGLSALLHHVPTFCMGRALYDLPGLTTRGSLEGFWHKQDPVCKKTFERMRQSLLHLTQLNASFYRHLDMGAMAVVEKIQQHNVQALSAQKSQRAATPSGVVGALAILSAFCLLTEEMLTPVTML